MATAREAFESQPQVAIRAMQEGDVDSVVAIERDAYPFPWSEGIMRDCLRVAYLCRVMEADGLIIGYGIMSMGGGEAHVLNLCIRREYRNHGFGRRLLDELLDHAQRSGMSEAYLEVRPTNVTAIRLYQAMGFEQAGIRRGYYQAAEGREDAVVLKRRLNA